MVELLILVNKALTVVEGRRRNQTPLGPQPRRRGREAPKEIDFEPGYWHNFPQIIGRVLDVRRREPVSGVSVTLSAGKLGVLRTERGWRNPCSTSNLTDGYFSLWPRALRDGREGRNMTFRFTFEHPGYLPATRLYRYRSRGDLAAGEELRLDKVINLGAQLLQPIPARR
jgi:hypothetical protein